METIVTGTIPYRPSRGDRWSLFAFIAAGIAAAAATVVLAILRILEILGPGPTTVPVTFGDFQTALPFGDPDRTLSVAVDTGTIAATELPIASTIAGILAPVTTAIMVITIVACLIALSLSLLRGTIFSRRNTRLVSVAGIVGLVGFGATKLFEVMLANGALAWATDRQYDNLAVAVSPTPFLIAAFAIALICTVFSIGERMQRDQEGLV